MAASRPAERVLMLSFSSAAMICFQSTADSFA
jgi:hypothetical protein